MATPLVLITGGVRSGKSRYAETLASAFTRVCYLATAWPGDTEMEERIRHHRCGRPEHWQTVEEQRDLAGIVENITDVDCLLVDCLGMWVTNLLCGEQTADVENSLAHLLRAVESFPGAVIMVSNEVGWGLVPENKLARQFRDMLGWVNQAVAQAADEVVLLVAGCPLPVKGAGGKKHGG